MVSMSSLMTETLSRWTPRFLSPPARKWVFVSWTCHDIVRRSLGLLSTFTWPFKISSPMIISPAVFLFPELMNLAVARGSLWSCRGIRALLYSFCKHFVTSGLLVHSRICRVLLASKKSSALLHFCVSQWLLNDIYIYIYICYISYK